MRVKKAIYGCIESALLWYNLYVTTLEKEGFVLNAYDRCVANKMINGKQCTICWYVDDNKLSHMEAKVLDELVDTMKGYFGELTVTKGKKHQFLGINITLHDDGRVEYEMKDQLREAIEAFDDTIEGIVTSPAAKYLFDTREGESKLLDEKKQENFHSVTAKLLYLMKRARPDIEVPIAYLCTRVGAPNEDDWKKLKRVLIWIQCTIEETRFMGISDLGILFNWIDASYGVHPNMRSHTGGAMSMGIGLLHCKSSKQKLNTKSSTESELVGVSDYVPYSIWTGMFLEAQGYKLKQNIIYQDNQSAIKMEKNGRNSCTGRSRHINIRYFFVKDRVDKGELEIEYCPTLEMLADYYTKPLQGGLFQKFWKVIMGREPITFLKSNDEVIEIQERVENDNISIKNIISSTATIKENEKEKEENKAITWADVVKNQYRTTVG